MAKLPEAPEFKSNLKGYARDEVDRYMSTEGQPSSGFSTLGDALKGLKKA